ncbi:Transcription-repair-coupling factor [Sesbania bispinosa]|nr:Transcription-repair-coupling factor [Sesbania bispinosa]
MGKGKGKGVELTHRGGPAWQQRRRQPKRWSREGGGVGVFGRCGEAVNSVAVESQS